MSKSVFGQHFLNQSIWVSKNRAIFAILCCSMHCTIS